ncbi:MAG: alpha/beta hydrolase domain-containing protein [Geminicoccaceae bacterium]
MPTSDRRLAGSCQKPCLLAAVVLTLLTAAWPALGAVERVEILVREPFADGRIFGKTGAYERIKGRLHYAIDPDHPMNQAIVDLALAPVDQRGLVVFTGDFILLRPADPERGNRTLLYEVNNRGGLSLLPMFNRAARSNNPTSPAHAGDGLVFEQGYSLLWSAWNWDVVAGGDRLLIDLPVATEPITGPVAAEFVLAQPVQSAPFMWGRSIGYPPKDPDDPAARLSWRDEPDGKRQIIPRTSWRFSDFDTTRSPPQPTRITREQAFVPGRIYEVVYEARDPRIVGLGLAAIRDAVSYFRYEDTQAPLTIDQAIMFGISQSGRVINHMLWQGFHRDEAERPIVDGAFVHVAGAGKGSFNHRFAQTTRHPSQYEDHQYPADIFPFTTVPESDPTTGERGDMLALARASGTVPKLFYTTTSTEYWTRAASLLHTDVDGKRDVPLAPEARLYHFAGAQHGNWRWHVHGPYQHCTNALDHGWSMRALLTALGEWVQNGKEPPSSVYPTFADGTLGTVEQYLARFPTIPETRLPGANLRPPRLNLGQRFKDLGIADMQPAKLGAPFVTSVPLPDADGLDLGGIRLPQIAVPVATYTGWNLRRRDVGAPGKLARWSGSMLPFALNETIRAETSDPRPSLAARYRSEDDYGSQVEAAASALRAQGFLLGGDIDPIVAAARERYNRVRDRDLLESSCAFTLLPGDDYSAGTA